MNEELLKVALNKYGVNTSDEQIKNLHDLVEKTLETSEKFNLTAIKDRETFYEKMILDSALGLVNVDLKNKKVIDVGTGAGFPGMVLYILNPEMDITLLDSTAKKINYLADYSKEKDYHINFEIARAEEYALKHREKYDVGYARAVASLNILIELIVPMIKVNGLFVAMKGPLAKDEIESSKRALKELECEIIDIHKYVLPESGEERNIIIIKKKKESKKRYPRKYSEIKSRPL